MNILLSRERIGNILVCHTKKGFSSKPKQNGFYGKVLVEEVSFPKFIQLIKNGHSFKQVPDIDSLQNSVREITENGKNPRINANNIRKGNITMNILQRRLVMQYCQFQTIFFDIDECKINHEELIKKLSLKPNLIYETFSYTETNRRYRLVYILDEPINTGFYKSVYLAFKEQIKDIVEDDKCAENPTQTIFGTNNNVYEINDFYYHINTSNLNFIYYGDVVLKQYTPSIVEENFYNYCMTHPIPEIVEKYSTNNRIYHECVVDWNFNQHDVVKQDFEYKCIDVEFETPNNINDKFCISNKGLLALPHFVGNRKKLVVNDGRKRYIERIAHLLLLMNKDLVIEDLIYNVLKWCQQHISFNKNRNEHLLNNKIIVEKCISCFDNFKNNTSMDYLNYLKMLSEEYVSTKKKAVNPYYQGLHYKDNTFFYWRHFQHIDFDKSISLSELETELSTIKVQRRKSEKYRRDKGKKRNIYSGSRKNEIIEMVLKGHSNKEISLKFNVSSQYVSKIKNELHITKLN